MDPVKVVGIVLVKNEERYLEQVVRNIAGFCDKILLCDHASTDATPGILETLTKEIPHAELHLLNHPRESHDLLKPYCGSNTWIFAADGDEIYDLSGLRKMKERLHAGEFDNAWTVFGNVLNVTSLSADHSTASGHLAPPCRSMTKLYNFSAISSWDGDCIERLHGGQPVYRPGYAATSRRYLHEEMPWEQADFRCLHLCFLPRSSVDASTMRRNIVETYGMGHVRAQLAKLTALFARARSSRWKNERYRRGPVVTVDSTPFFSPKI